MASATKQSHYELLKQKWNAKQQDLQEKLWSQHGEALQWVSEKTKNLATMGSLGGLLLLAPPSHLSLPQPHFVSTQSFAQAGKDIDKKAFLILDLSKVLPKQVRPLTEEEEKKVSEVLSRSFGLKVSALLDGKRLNRSYGLIGAEQHLARYPGDSMATHFDNQEEAQEFYSSGMAPGLGAWGYFSPAKQQFTEKDKLREKYYIAVQTFLAPDFTKRVSEYRDFFKYRKMLVVNPENGKAIVSVIGDAGPAEWTGKHLGGSPEVMKYLERVDGARRGPVLYFFIDDPNDTIPLGPIEINS